MRKKIGRSLKKVLNVVMVVGILMSSFPITPFIPKVNALASVSGDKIIETAMTYESWGYWEVGTCTGLVTRTLNKLGVGQSIVGIHPYDIDKPQPEGTGARYAPDKMYQNALNHPEDAIHIWSGYVKDVKANAELFENGDLVLQRPEDKANYNGSGHAALIHVYNGNISMYGANGEAMGIGDAVLATGVATRGISYNVNSMDYIHVFRLTKAEPEYATTTSEKSAQEVVNVSFYKTDLETGKPLSGVEVEFYRDDVKFATGITDDKGYATATSTTTYTSSSSPKTYVTNWDDLGEEEQAEVDERGAYHNLVDAQAAADSEALKSATDKASQTHKYSIVEVKTKTKYWLNPDNTTDSDSATGSGSISLSLSNERVKGTAVLIKEDFDVGYAQNEAQIDGALYGLYANENILDPADGSIIYNAGDEITRVRIENGQAQVDNLYLGKYFWLELTSSDGYKLNKNKEFFELSYSSQNVKVVTSKSVSKEEVITADFEIEKIITSGDESEIVQKEEGAEFIVVAKKYVDKYGDIETAWEHREEFTDKEYDKLVTNKNGYDKSKQLAYGSYIGKQVKGKMDTELVENTFTFTVSKENQDTIKYIINNRLFTSYVKIQKVDSETGKLITASNTTFKIKNADTGEYLTQKVADTTHDTWKTSDKGMVQLPLEVKAGNWLLEEIESPDNYLINKEGVSFKVTNTNIIETDSDGDPLLTVVMEDQAVKGQIKVEKYGEVLVGVEEDENGNIQFIYEERPLADMIVYVQADEDILDPADNSVIYKKGELVDVITTTSSGEGYSKLIPLGDYVVYEYQSPSTMIIDTNQYKVSLNFIDNETEVVMETISITNERQKVEVDLTKLDLDSETPIEGVVFGLYAIKDIYPQYRQLLRNGRPVLVEEGTLIETAVSDKDGKVKFLADLPISIDDEIYFEIREIEPKEGYYESEEVISIDTMYKGQNIEKISNSQTIYNEIIKNYILVNKVDSTTLENIISKDFKFSVCSDAECKDVIAEYDADVETGTALIDIIYGTTVFIKETSAPEGYLLSPEVIKVNLNSEGLFVNDEKVETDEELLYSIIYQNTLLPVIQEEVEPEQGVQTGYDNNMPIYIAISGLSLAGVIAIAISLCKKKKRRK